MEVHVVTRKGTHMVNFDNITIVFESALHIVNRHPVLDLIVHIKNAYTTMQVMPANIVNTQVEKNTAVLSARKGNIDIVKFPKNKIQPFLYQFIDILPPFFYISHGFNPPCKTKIMEMLQLINTRTERKEQTGKRKPDKKKRRQYLKRYHLPHFGYSFISDILPVISGNFCS